MYGRLRYDETPVVWLMTGAFGKLAPVGEPVALGVGRAVRTDDFAADRTATFVDSGTSALALAMTVAAGRRQVVGAEVVLPGYGCPDLVAAAHFAGLTPRLVDLAADRPGYDLAQLRAALNKRTVAVVAVNFLGIPERLDALAEMTSAADALLIEDAAQWYARDAASRRYRGDLVVHSFGRGKPVSLLGGGVLLSTPEFAQTVQCRVARLARAPAGCMRWRAKAALYNLLLAPRAYALVASLPFLQLGATRYHRLAATTLMDDCRLRHLAANLDRYNARGRDVQWQIHTMLATVAPEGFVDLPAAQDCLDADLLRYPLLCPDRVTRDRIYRALQREGLGGSVMYAVALPAVEGVGGCEAGPLPQAERFADRLLTLPLTARVGPALIDRIGRIIAGRHGP